MATKNTLFRPSKAESKADTTTSVAKSIIESEKSERLAKTERLRKAREERDAGEEQAEPAKTPRSRTKPKRKDP
jgi:hypothetical protein